MYPNGIGQLQTHLIQLRYISLDGQHRKNYAVIKWSEFLLILSSLNIQFISLFFRSFVCTEIELERKRLLVLDESSKCLFRNWKHVITIRGLNTMFRIGWVVLWLRLSVCLYIFHFQSRRKLDKNCWRMRMSEREQRSKNLHRVSSQCIAHEKLRTKKVLWTEACAFTR